MQTEYQARLDQQNLEMARRNAAVANVALELAELIASGVTITVRPDQAAWLYGIENAGGLLDLETGVVTWQEVWT